MQNLQRRELRTEILLCALTGGLVLAPAAVHAQSGTMPDAQVEANVLRQLASAPELSTQNIQASTVYGTVTLSGNVHDETARTRAENLAARAQGVKKVVDELTLGDTPAPAANSGQYAQTGGQYADAGVPAGQVLQSDGTYAPAPSDNTTQAGMPGAGQNTYPVQPGYPGAPEYGSNVPAQPQGQPGQQPYSSQGYPQGGSQYQQPGDGGQQQAYGNPPPPPSPPRYGAPVRRQPGYPNGYTPYPNDGGGQVGGQQVTVAGGSVLRVRLDRGFDANRVKPGTPFSGTVMQDILANGAVAIPRGAQVQGTVVDAKRAGVLKGQAQLGLQITGLALGGQTYTLTTDVWEREGRDKTVSTVNNAVGFGAVGAILGGIAGGGSGAAIGAGVGGAAGVANSAASPGGRVLVPAEAVLTFRLAQPASVTTVGQQELLRLSYATGLAQPRPARQRRYYSPYYGYYYGPAYYR